MLIYSAWERNWLLLYNHVVLIILFQIVYLWTGFPHYWRRLNAFVIHLPLKESKWIKDFFQAPPDLDWNTLSPAWIIFFLLKILLSLKMIHCVSLSCQRGFTITNILIWDSDHIFLHQHQTPSDYVWTSVTFFGKTLTLLHVNRSRVEFIWQLLDWQTCHRTTLIFLPSFSLNNSGF